MQQIPQLLSTYHCMCESCGVNANILHLNRFYTYLQGSWYIVKISITKVIQHYQKQEKTNFEWIEVAKSTRINNCLVKHRARIQ